MRVYILCGHKYMDMRFEAERDLVRGGVMGWGLGTRGANLKERRRGIGDMRACREGYLICKLGGSGNNDSIYITLPLIVRVFFFFGLRYSPAPLPPRVTDQ